MKLKESAGLAIIYDDKLLVVHPTNSKWWYTYGIPKGGLDEGETHLDAAIRETEEEIGIKIKKSLIDKKEYSFYLKKGNDKYKIVYYFIVHISDLSQIGIDKLRIDKNKLQKDEVDWGGFLDYKSLVKRITYSQKTLLDNLIKLGYLNDDLQNYKNYIKK